MLRILLLLLAVVLTGGVAVAAENGHYYRYKTENGSIAFTDELERVPERYRDAAVEVAPASVFDYARTTVTMKGASTESTVTSLPREEAKPAAAAGVQTMSLQVAPGVMIDVPVGGQAGKVKIRQGWRRLDDDRLVPYTYVVQNGKILVDVGDVPKPHDDTDYRMNTMEEIER